MIDISLPQMSRKPIALTGAACSGKTKMLEILARRPGLAERILELPEVFTDLAKRGFIKPTAEPDGVRYNQTAVMIAQAELERTLSATAAQRNLTLLCDRSLADSAVFLPGGIGEFEEIAGHSLDDVLARYGLIIELGLPPEDVFYAVRSENSARREDYEEVREQARRFSEVYGRHPHRIYVPYQQELDRKIALVTEPIAAYLQA